MQYLNDEFHDRLIGRGCPKKWVPRSPDLSPPDFHAWRYMKNKVYEDKVDTRDELLRRIFDVARRVNVAAVLRKVTIPIDMFTV